MKNFKVVFYFDKEHFISFDTSEMNRETVLERFFTEQSRYVDFALNNSIHRVNMEKVRYVQVYEIK